MSDPERNSYKRVSLNEFMRKLSAFAEPPPIVWEYGMVRAVWSVLERERGRMVRRLSLRCAIWPHRLDDRHHRIASDKTLDVAMCLCRKAHPFERITRIVGEGYRLERMP